MRTNDEIIDLLTRLKDEKNLSISEIARRVDMAKSAVSRYFNRTREFPLNRADEFAKVFGISTEYLLGVSSISGNLEKLTLPFQKLNEQRQLKVINYTKDQLEAQDQENIINLEDYLVEEEHDIYLQSKVSAGKGTLDLDPNHAEQISYKGKLPRYYDLAFEVNGDSMKPMFEDGEIIFVERMEYPINGSIMVVQIDDESFIKKIYVENDRMRLVSLNPEYKDIYANGDNEIRIVGKVVY